MARHSIAQGILTVLGVFWTIVVPKPTIFCLTTARGSARFAPTMEARLVTSPHQFVLPKVREVAPPTPAAREQSRPLTQRELVAASLLARPERAAAFKRA